MVTAVISIQYIALVILFVELIYVVLQSSPSKLQIILILLIISTFIMMAGYVFEIKAQTQEGAWYGTLFSYIGKPWTMLFAFLFIMEYCGIRVKRPVKMLMVVYQAAFSTAVALNRPLHLFYASVGFDRTRLFSPLVLSHGPAYYLYMATIFAYMLADLIVAVREYRRADNPQYRRLIYYIFGVIGAGILGFIVFISGITAGYDTTMLGCFFSTMLVAVLFSHYRIFSLVNRAKEESLRHAAAGLIVVDGRGKVAYKNIMASHLTDSGLTAEELLEKGRTPQNFFPYDGKYYRIKSTDFTENNHAYGSSVEIRDITDEYHYSERLARDVEARTHQIQTMQRSIVAGFAEIVEARDNNTGYHIRRTSDYVRVLAGEISRLDRYKETYHADYFERLVNAAPMHDIGKISVPDSILLKHGRLTPEEFEIMKTHTTAGAEIIEKTMRGIESEEYVTMAKDVALSHHERWDGTGYPNGLSGDDIPLAARIMAVADVYDALRSERPYKQPFTEEESAALIVQGKGTQFDPDVVEAFLAGRAEFDRIAREQ